MPSSLRSFAAAAALLPALLSSASAFSAGAAPPRRGFVAMRSVGKRGKSVVPPRLRHDYSHRVMERDLKSDTFEPHKTAGDDGYPAFNLFVRGHGTHAWLPCGSFDGCEASAALVDAFRDTDDVNAKEEIDETVARSLAGSWEANTNLDEAIFSVYPHLRKDKDMLEYGYKIAYGDELTKEQGRMSIITRKIMRP